LAKRIDAIRFHQRLMLMLIFVFRTSASDCLEDRLRNDL